MLNTISRTLAPGGLRDETRANSIFVKGFEWFGDLGLFCARVGVLPRDGDRGNGGTAGRGREGTEPGWVGAGCGVVIRGPPLDGRCCAVDARRAQQNWREGVFFGEIEADFFGLM